MEVLVTPRLTLEPITLDHVEAVFRGDRAELERLARASVPTAWPGRALVERAFSASLDRIRAAPDARLWGDRLIITRPDGGLPGTEGGERLVVGSVIFHGRPGADATAEIGYGVEESWQKHGIATEATRAAIEWALAQDGVDCVTATTPPWHAASIRVLEKSGMVRVAIEDHEVLGEVVRYERRCARLR